MNAPDKSPHEVTGTTLEELERFRQEIERYRARRKAVSDEFEGFVRGFKTPVAPVPDPRRAAATEPPPAAPTMAPPAAPPTAPPAAPVASAPAARAPQARETVPPPAPPLEVRLDADAPRPAATRRSWIPLALAAVLIVALAGWWFSRRPAEPTVASAPATAAAPAETPRPAAPAPEPPAPPDPFESVLTTTRPVWLRVIADGARVLNRELPAGARVPFKAEKTIEIRAGDAGAVRLSIGGRDQGALGVDGAVVTRSFTVPR
jgi:cytoskeleton protein RodZ